MTTSSGPWSLIQKIFDQLCAELFTPEIFLFVFLLNTQVDNYFSWFPDHHSQETDALSQSWESFKVYTFLPFCLTPRVLPRIDTEYEDAILILHFWPTMVPSLYAWFKPIHNGRGGGGEGCFHLQASKLLRTPKPNKS